MEKRLFWIDLLRVLACFGVVLFHAGASLLSEWGEIQNTHWSAANFYTNAMRWCVPVFLMISGAVILPKIYGSLGEYLGKRVLRLVWPFMFWNIVYLVMHFYLLWRSGHLSEINPLVETFVRLRDGLSYHFWYIYLIIGLTLFFPILGRWIRAAGEREILYFIAIWLVTVVAATPIVERFMPKIELQYFVGYVGYPVLGYYIANKQWNSPRWVRRIGTAMFVTAGATIITLTHIETQTRGELWTGLLSYLNPVLVIMATGLFLIFRNIDFEKIKPRFMETIRFLSRYSYGTYLVHVLVFNILWHFGIYHSFVHPAVGIPATAVVCFAVSVASVWIVNKIPRIGKYISG